MEHSCSILLHVFTRFSCTLWFYITSSKVQVFYVSHKMWNNLPHELAIFLWKNSLESTLGVLPSLVSRYCEGYSFWGIWAKLRQPTEQSEKLQFWSEPSEILNLRSWNRYSSRIVISHIFLRIGLKWKYLLKLSHLSHCNVLRQPFQNSTLIKWLLQCSMFKFHFYFIFGANMACGLAKLQLETPNSSDEFKQKYPKLSRPELKRFRAKSSRAGVVQFLSRNKLTIFIS